MTLSRRPRRKRRAAEGLAGGEHGGDAERHQQDGEPVVVGAADYVDEDERVEGDEGGGRGRVDAAGGGEARD